MLNLHKQRNGVDDRRRTFQWQLYPLTTKQTTQSTKDLRLEDHDMLPHSLMFSDRLETPHTRPFFWRYCLDAIRYLCISLPHGSALLRSRTTLHDDNEHYCASTTVLYYKPDRNCHAPMRPATQNGDLGRKRLLLGATTASKCPGNAPIIR